MGNPVSRKGYVAIEQPQFKKIEAQMRGGIAVAQQREEMISVALAMDYIIDDQYLTAGEDRVILRGDSGLQQWAKQLFTYEGRSFVLCPEAAVIGYVQKNAPGDQMSPDSIGGYPV